MPSYELVLILRNMPKQEVVECLKRAAGFIWKENGVLKKIEYMGYNKLPFAAKGHNEGERYHDGNYFLYHVSLQQSKLAEIRPELKLDLDIIKSKFNLCDEKKDEDYECTLEEELLPPTLRKSVRPLLKDKNVRTDVRR